MILLTGSSGGIGEQLLLPLSKFDEIIGIYNNKVPDNRKDFQGLFAKVDIASSESIASFIKQHEKSLKNITVIHCAVIKIDSLLVNFKEKDWDKISDVNIKGNFMLNKALLPIMMKNNWGRIIHISSVAGSQGAVGNNTLRIIKNFFNWIIKGFSQRICKI